MQAVYGQFGASPLLKQAIKDRGLDHLIAKSGEEAAQNAVASIEGKEAPFDPLMGASNMIFGHALDAAGLAVLMPGVLTVFAGSTHPSTAMTGAAAVSTPE